MLDYYLYGRDEAFDFTEQSIPSELRRLFNDQIERARTLLRNRSREEIEQAINDLNSIFRAAGRPYYDDVDLEHAEKEAVTVNRTKALKVAIKELNLTEYSSLSNPIWPEYFAAFALALIGEGLYEYKHGDIEGQLAKRMVNELNSNRDRKPFEYKSKHALTCYVCESAIEAMEAICIGEHLPGRESDAQTTRKYARKGGRRRESKYTPLKAKVEKLYRERFSDQNDREAARRILAILGAEDLAILNTKDPITQIAVWVGHLRKGRSIAN